MAGGGIGGVYSDAPILNCTVTANQAWDGAGVTWAYGVLDISNCTITGNIAGQSGGGIAGIECDSATITDCVVTGNEAPEGGAGVGFYDTPLTIIDCDISNNTGTTDGPGIGVFLEQDSISSPLQMSGCVINGNIGTTEGPYGDNEGYGGAVYYLNGPSAIFTDCTFQGNDAQVGGGLAIYSGSASVTLENCLIEQNSGTDGAGGGYLYGNNIAINQCRISENAAPDTGGLFIAMNTSEIINSILSDNTVTGQTGGLYLESWSGGDVIIRHCTVSGNTADSVIGGILCAGSANFIIQNVIFEGNTNYALLEPYPGVNPLVENCLFYNNPDGAYLDYPSTVYADADMAAFNSTVPEATDNITGDPSFIDGTNGNFHLTHHSAAIDKGIATSVIVDYDDMLRPVDIPGVGAEGTGEEYDIGAYEVQPGTPVAVVINQGAAQVDPATTLPVVFDVTFSEPVTGFDNTDVDFSASTISVTGYTVTDTGDGMNYTVEVTSVSWSGTIIATIPADVVTFDVHTGLSNEASTSTDNAVFYSYMTMIYNVTDLQNMQNLLSGEYMLANDIDASETSTWNSGAGFIPVGDQTTSFTGVLDGAGYTITGLHINRPGAMNCGLFGIANGALIKDVILAEVDVTGMGYSGGLVGEASSSNITNCHVEGTITINTGIAGGGLAGEAAGDTILTNCSADCTVSGSNNIIGGLVGQISGSGTTCSGCYASGVASGTDRIGGFAGYIFGGSVQNCYSTATAYGTGNYVGGLIGYMIPFSNITIENSYSVGAVSGSGNVGGLVGYILPFGITFPALIGTYWDIQSSGQANSAGGGVEGASEGKTTEEMLQQATFVGWDFSNTWSICENITYPFLQAIPNPRPVTSIEGTINQNGSQADPANTLPIVFDVAFSEPVTGFDNSDVDFSTGTATVTAYTVTDSGDGKNYTVAGNGDSW